jgi:phosphoenolpyruvate-protein phosphotransferase (PTS system enzyme I)
MKKRKRSKLVKGKPASSGIGIGKAWILEDRRLMVHPDKIEPADVSANIDKFQRAVDALLYEFEELKREADEDVTDIVEAQIQTLKDPELHKLIREKISQELSGAEYAIYTTFNGYIRMMEAAAPDWLEERTVDITSLRNQLISVIRQKKQKVSVHEGAVVFADEIPPTVMIELSRNNIAGIVMQRGGLTSHAVILSQSLGIPCVVGVNWKKYPISKGTDVAVDGTRGELILRPSEDELQQFKVEQEQQREREKREAEAAGSDHQTACGASFTLQANIEFLAELPRLTQKGARGIGLLRTETLLFEKRGFDVEDQVSFYSKVLEASAPGNVTIRLFDAGGDKLLEGAEEEANPFLGWRGIRMLLDRPNLLKNQLRAIYKTADKYPGRVRLLVPMISGLNEVQEVKRRAREVYDELSGSVQIGFDDVPFGIMIEVPSAALMADLLAGHVDFFSLGTNDLIQYTLAVDRGNEKIANLYDPHHPAVWKLLEMTRRGAETQSIPVSVCGEMASQPAAAACMLGMGIRELSMTTQAIPGVKALLCSRSLEEMKKLSRTVLSAHTSADVKAAFSDFMKENNSVDRDQIKSG